MTEARHFVIETGESGHLIAKSSLREKGLAAWRQTLIIAWSTCASCGKTIDQCIHDLPVEPAWIRRLRDGTATGVYGSENRFEPHKVSGGLVSDRKPKSPESAPVNVLDFVDDDLIAKVKGAKDA